MGNTEIKIYSKQITEDGFGGIEEKNAYHSTIEFEVKKCSEVSCENKKIEKLHVHHHHH